MIEPTIRLATSEDLDQLRLLEAEARQAVATQRGGARWLDEHPTRDWTDRARDERIFIGSIDEVVIGYLILSRPEPRLAVVDQVWVTPEARELGFGDALLAAALEAARADGASLFEGTALPGDRDTKNLYERAGITARSLTVSTRLDT